MSEGIRIFLIDSRELVRRGVRSMLEQEEDIEIVGDCCSAEEALFQIIRLHPDIVLMDTQLPGMSWIEAISSLKRSRPGASLDVIVLAESSDYRADALEAGASSCLTKDVTRTEFIQVLRNVYRNSHPLKEHDSLAEEIIEVVISPPANAATLLQFMCHLANILPSDFTSIISTVGSWDKGTVITIRSQLTMPSGLVIELANMPEVDKVEEQTSIHNPLSSLTNKFDFLSKSGISPSKRLRVALKEA